MALQQLLQQLRYGGFICGYQLVWGSLPGSWPANWVTSEAPFVDADQAMMQQEPIAAGTVFQVGQASQAACTTLSVPVNSRL